MINYVWGIRTYLVGTSAGGLYVPKGMIRPVDSVSAMVWLIRYIHEWNLQFLDDIIIITNIHQVRVKSKDWKAT
jgi:hypothetical protein